MARTQVIGFQARGSAGRNYPPLQNKPPAWTVMGISRANDDPLSELGVSALQNCAPAAWCVLGFSACKRRPSQWTQRVGLARRGFSELGAQVMTL